MLTPSTTIKFLKVPFSPSQNNLLKFSDVASQQTYMDSKIVYTMLNCTYQREGDGEFIRVNRSMDSLYNCNYVMFQNSNFGSKYFYAFIERMEYQNPSMTKVFIKMDTYQSFQFEFTIGKSFIERQTIGTDYYNTLTDTPSTGDLTTVFEYSKLLNGFYFVLLNSDPTVEDCSTSPTRYTNIGNYSMPAPLCYFSSASDMSDFVQAVSNKGRADRIQSCFYAPCITDLLAITHGEIPKGDLNMINSSIWYLQEIPTDKLFEDITFNIPANPTFKKELAYPYAKLEVVDKITGRYIELDLSKFIDPLNPTFRIYYTFTDRAEYKIVPMSYNGIPYSIENALVVDPSTEMPVFSNTYSKYLKDNGNSNLIQGAMGLTSMIGSVATGNVAGAVGSFASMAQVVNADSVARKQPNQVSNIKGDTMEYINNSPKIYFRLKVMDSDHIDIARNFWNAFGYPVRKVTNYSNTSQKFNFIKTVGANIIADTIPTEYQQDLENIFDKGVTIWNRDYLNYDII